jgi:hypothetical protein
MNLLVQLKKAALIFFVALACFGVSPAVRALLPPPPPDGGYPNQNTAEGNNALFSLSTGAWNTAVGFRALYANTTSSDNTAIGWQAPSHNTSETDNTATGAKALFSNTTGITNTANGAFALASNTTGNYNTANGYEALRFNTEGNYNTATGHNAVSHNTTGINNTANGDSALTINTTGGANTGIGAFAFMNCTTGDTNTAIGIGALGSISTGDNNAALGFNAGGFVTTASNVICIGTPGANVSNSCYIGRIFGATAVGGSAVFIDANNKLGTITSSKRFKEDIRMIGRASEVLFSLNPVTFRYKKEIDPAGISQFGLLAEQVEKVNPDLVVRDEEGKAYSVRYDQVNAMLLNEFLKEHRKVQEQEATISQLKQDLQATAAHQEKQIEALTAGLRKVSAQFEASKPAPQVAENP